jgi:hypothetical protein
MTVDYSTLPPGYLVARNVRAEVCPQCNRVARRHGNEWVHVTEITGSSKGPVENFKEKCRKPPPLSGPTLVAMQAVLAGKRGGNNQSAMQWLYRKGLIDRTGRLTGAGETRAKLERIRAAS